MSLKWKVRAFLPFCHRHLFVLQTAFSHFGGEVETGGGGTTNPRLLYLHSATLETDTRNLLDDRLGWSVDGVRTGSPCTGPEGSPQTRSVRAGVRRPGVVSWSAARKTASEKSGAVR